MLGDNPVFALVINLQILQIFFEVVIVALSLLVFSNVLVQHVIQIIALLYLHILFDFRVPGFKMDFLLDVQVPFEHHSLVVEFSLELGHFGDFVRGHIKSGYLGL